MTLRFLVDLPELPPNSGITDEDRLRYLRRKLEEHYGNALRVVIDDRPRGMQYQCPDCPWAEYANRYGWDHHNARAVEVHQHHLCPGRKVDPPSE